MKSDDLTVQILTEIRDEIRTTRTDLGQRIDQTNLRVDKLRDELGSRIDETNVRIDQTNARITESEIRTSTALHELNGTMRDVHGLLRDRLDLRDRVDRCERDIEDLKHRVG